MLSDKIRLLLKKAGINLTFPVSGYRSLLDEVQKSVMSFKATTYK